MRRGNEVECCTLSRSGMEKRERLERRGRAEGGGWGEWREWGDRVEKHMIGGKIRNYKYGNHATEYFIPCFPLVWVAKIK